MTGCAILPNLMMMLLQVGFLVKHLVTLVKDWALKIQEELCSLNSLEQLKRFNRKCLLVKM